MSTGNRELHELKQTLRSKLDQLDAESEKELSVRVARYLISEFGGSLNQDQLRAADSLVINLEQGLQGSALTRTSHGPTRSGFFDSMYAAEGCARRLLGIIHLAERASFQRETERAGLVVRHRHKPKAQAVLDGLLRISPDPASAARWGIDQATELLDKQR